MPKILAIQKAKDLLASGLPRTKEEAQRLAKQLQEDEEVLIYLLLELAKSDQVGEETPVVPSIPSGMIPPLQKRSGADEKEKPTRRS